MIFESVAVMTIIDLIVLAIVGRAFWVVLGPARSHADWKASTGRKCTILGLLLVAAFFATDLVVMYLLPFFIPRADAMAFMTVLHLNYSWILAAGGIGLVIIGFTRIDLRLRKMIRRLAQSREELKEPAAASEGDNSNDAVVELAVLIEMFGDDAEMRNAILSEFPPAAWEGVAEIESAYDAKDWAALGAAGHKLKSSARTIGANHLADICEALEEAGRAGDEKTINKLMPQLRPAMEAVVAFIRGRE